jgi:hypothetical protein
MRKGFLKRRKSENNSIKTAKKSKHILGLIAFFLFGSYLFILGFLRDNYLSWRLWAIYIVLITVIQYSIWRRLAQWIRNNREKIYHQTFEFLFLIFIFLTSYLLCLLIEKNFPLGIISISFIFSAMSSAYCGELYFLEGISDSRTKEELKKTYSPGKIRHYDERIFIVGFYSIFLPFIYYSLFRLGIDPYFLQLFSYPILFFLGMYIVIFVLTKGEYYKNTAKNITIISVAIILGIFLAVYGFNKLFNLIYPETIDMQIKNFIETFF